MSGAGKGPIESAIDAVTARAERAETERDVMKEVYHECCLHRQEILESLDAIAAILEPWADKPGWIDHVAVREALRIARGKQ